MKFNFDFLYRKKPLDANLIEDTKLSRVLGVLDITALGTLPNFVYYSNLFLEIERF